MGTESRHGTLAWAQRLLLPHRHPELTGGQKLPEVRGKHTREWTADVWATTVNIPTPGPAVATCLHHAAQVGQVLGGRANRLVFSNFLSFPLNVFKIASTNLYIANYPAD